MMLQKYVYLSNFFNSIHLLIIIIPIPIFFPFRFYFKVIILINLQMLLKNTHNVVYGNVLELNLEVAFWPISIFSQRNVMQCHRTMF